ncbi:CLUMA_CG021576, isoform A [Clunio marinus]|uniref:CLUMA_CG021576, isoform A n=1 Tax=Clunio marinus TaxID=568069 RepID=A0A1J1J898_9DIPT|nr:CLUMA_CG021576, isoform A [Clunio marinus]
MSVRCLLSAKHTILISSFLTLCCYFALAQLSQTDPNCINYHPPLSVLPEQCCMMPDFFDDADLIKCKTSHGTESLIRDVINRRKRFATTRIELGICYLNCVFKLADIISDDQIIDVERFKEKLTSETPLESNSIDTINNSITKCVNDLDSGVIKAHDHSTYNCSSIPSSLMMCVHMNFFLNCPSNRFNLTDQCIELQDYLRRCPITL